MSSKNVKETAKFVAPGRARKILGISDATLRRWAETKKIESFITPSGRRLYNVENLFGVVRPPTDDAIIPRGSKSFLYARVSSSKQRDDLQRQIDFLKEKHPDFEVVSDIASGINWQRKGLRKLLDLSSAGGVERIVVAERDRLCRFAFELVEYVFSINGTIVEVVGSEESSPEQELQEDLLSIVQVFCCRRNGKRRYKGKKKDENPEESCDRNSNHKDSSDKITETTD
ncbi:resolvase [Paramecium bursaria Chlorella virus NY2B]|uniref:Uncharacterized protein B083L n=2 Tax=Chlorovirus TaxID=181083 RepID=A7IVV8_PBCVN|nr:transposase [Paramecium bursaria Chlorella virus NY2A]YP_001497577.1 transposase [Paramecium bursaria Chlorella virus NY2A]YP_001497911.1 transposase [Paramecium bursaria Chlorella virus NY2A]YP_009665214.1 transposase [Paramecium bursaria Chlorella virus NYs1]AGE58234.1 resolvase [Paramecium bursaria Chlorella virus NY2B]ABT14482.1 hypothetical protein NY2A_B083L [Paramecium bursaria Chlorella virus NY2A]ABT14780.1 hypothetical protein NY2A_B381L [Paramecium bursaria Chlorella virus NY2A]